MTTLIERLTSCLVDEKTKVGLKAACGIAQSSVSAWFSGKTKKIEGANLLRAATYLGVNPEWLATGLGPMRPSGEVAQGVIQFQQPSAPAHARKLVQTLCDMAEKINDDGVNQLIGAATILTCSHPLKAKKAGTRKAKAA